MKASPALTATVRFPWPDEQARLRQLLPITAGEPTILRTWLWVLAASHPERLVGAAALQERSAGIEAQPTGWLELAIKSAWRETAAADDLIATALQAAEELRLSRLDFETDPDSPLSRSLTRRGFVAAPVQELWRVRPEEVWGEHGPALLRGFKRHTHGPIEPLTLEDLPGVRELCSHFGFLPPQRVQLQPAANGFDPGLSFGIKVNQSVRAAILCRQHGPVAYLEVFALFPDVNDIFSTAAGGLMLALLEGCLKREVRELYCVVRPAMTPELIGLLKRGQGRRVKRHALFSRPLGSPDRSA